MTEPALQVLLKSVRERREPAGPGKAVTDAVQK